MSRLLPQLCMSKQILDPVTHFFEDVVTKQSSYDPKMNEEEKQTVFKRSVCPISQLN